MDFVGAWNLCCNFCWGMGFSDAKMLGPEIFLQIFSKSFPKSFPKYCPRETRVDFVGAWNLCCDFCWGMGFSDAKMLGPEIFLQIFPKSSAPPSPPLFFQGDHIFDKLNPLSFP